MISSSTMLISRRTEGIPKLGASNGTIVDGSWSETGSESSFHGIQSGQLAGLSVVSNS